jgi:hypothetical protein
MAHSIFTVVDRVCPIMSNSKRLLFPTQVFGQENQRVKLTKPHTKTVLSFGLLLESEQLLCDIISPSHCVERG